MLKTWPQEQAQARGTRQAVRLLSVCPVAPAAPAGPPKMAAQPTNMRVNKSKSSLLLADFGKAGAAAHSESLPRAN